MTCLYVNLKSWIEKKAVNYKALTLRKWFTIDFLLKRCSLKILLLIFQKESVCLSIVIAVCTL